ncbi:hypothetical protein Tco_0537653 [Tanacetum coccineum]
MQHNVDMKKVSRVLWQSFLEEAECGNTNNNDIAMKEQANQEQTPNMMSDTKKYKQQQDLDKGKEIYKEDVQLTDPWWNYID